MEAMHWIRLSVLVVVFALLQSSLIGAIGITTHHIQPSLFVILLIYVAVHSTPTDAIGISFLIGLVADLFGSAVGPQVIAFGVVGTLIAELRYVVRLREMPQQMLAAFVAGTLTAGIALLLYPLKGQPGPPTSTAILLGQALYSAVLYPLVSWPLDFVVRMRRRRALSP